MAEPVAILYGAHRCRLKWHRAKRHATDTAFTADRIRQGLLAGAVVEVDLNPLAQGGWVILHDPTLDRETTGAGHVSAIRESDLASLRLRDSAGRPTPHPVASLGALARDLAAHPLPEGGHLQLDLKVGADSLTPGHVHGFVRDVAPIAGHVILSGGDALAVRRLADASGVGVGFDPCHSSTMLDLAASRAFDAFVSEAVAAVPDARIIYLHRALVRQADQWGCDLLALFRDRQRDVDVYTFESASPTCLREIERLLHLKADQVTTDDPTAIAAMFEVIVTARSPSD